MIKTGIVVIMIAIVVFSITAYASTVSITPKTDQSVFGISFTNTNNITPRDRGFSVQGSTQAASALPCAWTNGGTCRQALTLNHYIYTLTIVLNTVPGSSTTYTVTTKWDQGAGQVVVGGSALTVTVPTTATAGQTMTFIYDTGSTTFTTPQSMDVTIV